MWIRFYNWKLNFNSKNFKNSFFSCKTKSSISFIPMRRMCLCCLITKRKEIIMWIHVYPIEKGTLIRKMVEGDVFFWNHRLNIIYSNEENVYMMPNHERNEDYSVNPRLSQLTSNINSKNGRKKFSLWNQSVNNIYPNGENEFVGAQSLKERRLLCKFEFIQLKNEL